MSRGVSPAILAATEAMSREDRAHLTAIARPRLIEPYTKHIPHPAQQLFLSLNGTEEVMYGGAAGGGKCLTEDHDVLTPDGWVPIATVNTGDLVASWHTDGAMTWERVAATYAYDHDGPLRTSPMFRATPNHKWRAGHRSTANEVKTWRWYDATELRPQMSVPAVGEPLPTGSGDLSPEEMELLGWWLSEGSGYDKNMARISQTKPEGRARIIKLCEYLGLKHTVYEREIRVRWEVPDRRGTAYDKFIPRWAFQQRNLQNLLDGLLAGDGYMRRDGWEYSSSSKQLAEDVQELATRLGLRATMRQKKVASDNPHWIVSAYPRKTWTLNTTLGWEQFTGKVYCITVPATSTFLVRHNGRIHVTGNSDALLMAALQYAIGVHTPIPTPDGWSTVADLQVGDQVFDECGNPVKVVAKSQVFQGGDRFRITFDDRQEIVADGDHMWVAETFADRMSMGRNLQMPMRAVTTREMYRTQKTNHRKPANNWSVRLAKPLRLPAQELPIDPYVFGVWLGDGSKRDGTVAGTDPEVTDEFRKAGYRVTLAPSGDRWHVKGLRTQLEALGVRNNKHVPVPYLRGDEQQRLALLQGLMDSDGTVDGRWGIPRFANTNTDLIDAVCELASSLGWKARVFQEDYTTVASKYTRRIQVVTFIADKPVFRLPRKAERQELGRQRPTARAQQHRIVQSIELVEPEPVQCITVDGESHLYLAGKAMIPTHNCDVPGYSALILRRTWADLSLPGAIMDRAREWLSDTDARPRDGGRIWVFPSGARISFGYLQYDKDKFRYQSAEFQFIGFDELTQFEQSTYEYMFSRIRRPALVCLRCSKSVRRYDGRWKHTSSSNKCDYCLPDPKVLSQYGPSKKGGITLFDVPLRMRSATNPGGSGHQWVRDHFIDARMKKPEAIFVPALLTDNPSLDQASYRKNLEHLNPIDRERLLNGDWDVSEEGAYFQRHWFRFLKHRPDDPKIRWLRYWDLAATVTGDYTAGALVGLTPDNEFIVADIRRTRSTPKTVERFIAATAHEDGHSIPIRMEQEPGASGVALIDHYRRNILLGYDFRPDRKDRSKEIRANPASSQVEAGNVYLVASPWNKDFLDEVSIFPLGAHDDQCDAFTGAFTYLAKRKARLLV